MAEKKAGFATRTARAAKRVGKAYVWTVTGDLGELKANTKRIKDGIKGILSRKYRSETFEQAAQRLGLSVADLNARANYLASLAFLFGLITLIALVFLLATPLAAAGHRLNHAAMSFGVMFVAGSKFITTRFRIAQIRQRRFFEFKDWLLGRKS